MYENKQLYDKDYSDITSWKNSLKTSLDQNVDNLGKLLGFEDNQALANKIDQITKIEMRYNADHTNVIGNSVTQISNGIINLVSLTSNANHPAFVTIKYINNQGDVIHQANIGTTGSNAIKTLIKE